MKVLCTCPHGAKLVINEFGKKEWMEPSVPLEKKKPGRPRREDSDGRRSREDDAERDFKRGSDEDLEEF